MASMYAQYILERTGDHILETHKGFATYRFINDKSVYLMDIFVLPEYRRSSAAAQMADKVAELAVKAGCNEMIGTVLTSAKNSTDSVKVLLAYGMILQSSSNEALVFRKAI